MGYYSDVMVSTTQDGFEFLKERCKEHDLFSGWSYEEHVNDDDGVVFGWSCVKWYPSFDDVSEFMSALDDAAEADIPWEYIEIGEDNATDCYASHGDLPDELLTHHIEPNTNIQIWNS